MNRRRVATTLFAVSFCLIVAGIALIYGPAALVAAGLMLGALLFIDLDGAART